jgi:hypothetical protein
MLAWPLLLTFYLWQCRSAYLTRFLMGKVKGEECFIHWVRHSVSDVGAITIKLQSHELLIKSLNSNTNKRIVWVAVKRALHPKR